MLAEELVASYLKHKKSCTSNIKAIRRAVKEDLISEDTLKKTFLKKIIDKKFSPTRLRLKGRISCENSQISSDSKEVSSGEASLDFLSYGTEQWMHIIRDKKGIHIVWQSSFPEIFTDNVNHDEEIDNLTSIVLYITN
jgi:hypothetical protein